LKLLSFGGRTVILIAFLQIVLLYAAIKNFVAIAIPEKKRHFVLILLLVNPIFGFTAMTVSHDSTLVIGVFLLIISQNKENRIILTLNWAIQKRTVLEILGYAFLSTNYSGWLIIIGHVVLRFRRTRIGGTLQVIRLLTIATTFTALPVIFFSGNTNNYGLEGPSLPFLADIKCVTQYHDSEIGASTWKYLETLGSREYWLSNTDCSTIDETIHLARKYGAGVPKLNRQFIKEYYKIVSLNPRVVLFAHLKRSAEVIPPPFVMANWNNSSSAEKAAIDDGFFYWAGNWHGVVHLSVDEKSVQNELNNLKILSVFAKSLGLLMNSASWFFGWGGIWLLFPALYYFIERKEQGVIWKEVLFYLGILHLFIFIMGPAPVPRYSLTTLFFGYISFNAILLRLMAPLNRKK
jgi:hypothetical protein